jgi:hypothetical protein
MWAPVPEGVDARLGTDDTKPDPADLNRLNFAQRQLQQGSEAGLRRGGC